MGSCCIKKTCCCGRELSSGAFTWAILDIVAHLFFLPLPTLLSDFAGHSLSFMATWVLLIILVNALLLVGIKAERPAFLTVWLVIYMINILLCIAVLAGIFLNIFLRLGGVEYITDELLQRHLTFIPLIFAIILAIVCPICHSVFWSVVFSLRRRMMMEIKIGVRERNKIGPQDPVASWMQEPTPYFSGGDVMANHPYRDVGPVKRPTGAPMAQQIRVIPPPQNNGFIQPAQPAYSFYG